MRFAGFIALLCLREAAREVALIYSTIISSLCQHAPLSCSTVALFFVTLYQVVSHYDELAADPRRHPLTIFCLGDNAQAK
jgi:hypothetical protein